MSIVFNAEEILSVAVKIEQNGVRFYTHAAGKADSDRVRDFFLGLATFERAHEWIFSQMKSKLGDQDRAKTVFDPEGQSAEYLKALADGRVFDVNADPVGKLSGRESAAEILEFALGMEKDSIIFYLGMKELVPAGMGKEKIDDIIKEEMQHITILSRELAALKG